MSARNKKDDNFSCEVIRVLCTERLDAKNRIELRIVKWAKAAQPVLEKRRIWEREDGDRFMKTYGLTLDDVKWVYDHYPEIINLM